MNFEKILIVDDEPSGRRVLEVYLRSQQFSVSTAGTLAEADRLMQQEFFDLLLVDLDLPDGDGCEWLQRAADAESRPIALVISGNGNNETATRCLRAGAFDYLAKPYALETLTAAMERAAVFRHARLVCRYLAGGEGAGGELPGDSPAIRHLRLLAARAAAAETPVLISGERGTGKSRVAGMIHRGSARAQGPLVRVRCAGADETRLENELFGRITETCEEGGGRLVLKGGRLELAEGGTLLLEEVSELPVCLQIKLLDTLRERVWVRPGEERRMRLDVRVMATSRRDLAGCVARGTFLPELYTYFSGTVLHVPPLRERIADLPMLATDWLERHGGSARGIAEEALRHLMAYSWPGNLRELENVLERAALLAQEGARMEAEAFEGLCIGRHGAGRREGGDAGLLLPEARPSAAQPEPLLTLEELEKRQVLRALEVTNQNRTRAANLLKISVRTLRNKLHQYRAEDPTLMLTLARRR
ncbi:MAG: sigma-54 dependent transcriptional regulator, partial [Chthoniobacteraceae bacterium]|nr:sigma-54 dependent transcriptional regulator [Chthoniobacteraceae bacterium]